MSERCATWNRETLIRVFPRRTKWTPMDDLTFVGDPPLFYPTDRTIPVMVSVTFTWDIPEGKRLARSWSRYYDCVQIGGPAFDDPGGEFIPGRFIKPGVTITSRGCPRRCPWCMVHRREGRIRTLAIQPGWIVQDNNLLACPRDHLEAVFRMLGQQPKGAIFSGGLDARLFERWHRDLLDTIRLNELWFAADTASEMKYLEKATSLLDGISQEKRRCYVLVGFGRETPEEAEYRLDAIYRLGFLPFAQLFRDQSPMQYSPDWLALTRKWSRPAAYRKMIVEA